MVLATAISFGAKLCDAPIRLPVINDIPTGYVIVAASRVSSIVLKFSNRLLFLNRAVREFY